ncbi:hypothetical protein EON65_29210 [archaeon]|nr:MAG: hypothetical protein EON65_29210 [archaeon]
MLTVVGPSGLKAYLQFMTPFINRKYPALDIHEIESEGDETEEIAVKHAKLTVKAVRADMVG